MAWSGHVESTGDIPKNGWTKGRGFNESEITKTKQNKANLTPEKDSTTSSASQKKYKTENARVVQACATCGKKTRSEKNLRSLFHQNTVATQLRTDGVHCRESAGTRPVNLKVVSNECCLLGRWSSWTNQYTSLFPTPTNGKKWACWKYRRHTEKWLNEGPRLQWKRNNK